MRINRIYLISCFCLILSLVAGCAGGTEPTTTPTGPLTEVTLQLNWIHSPQFGGFYMAHELGYYAEEGIEVIFQEGGFVVDFQEVAMMKAGELDFAVIGMPQKYNLIGNEVGGNDTIATAAFFQIAPQVLLTLKDSNIRNPREMIGRRVAIKNKGWQNRIHATLLNAGVDPSTIVEVEVENNSNEVLYDGTVDVWSGFASEEVVTAQLDGYDLNVIYVADYAGGVVGSYSGMLVSYQPLFEQDPELVNAFTRASIRGWQYFIENPGEAVDILQTWDPEQTREYHEVALHKLTPLVDTGQEPIGWLNAERWEREVGEQHDHDNPAYTLDGLLTLPEYAAWYRENVDHSEED